MSPRIAHLTRPVFEQNPVALQMLGVCSALAVTKTLAAALLMCAALTAVLTCSNIVVSALRRVVPHSIRLIVEITIIASLVIVADQLLQAYAYALSRQLSVFVALIVTNCIVLGRSETFALQNGVVASALDGLGNALGYSVVLATVATVRELLGAGSLLGYRVLPLASEGGWFVPLELMGTAPSAFFVIGFLIWGLRTWRREQVEPTEFATAGGTAP
jgi:Na+-transporting NADH:ubiquinone oxidoreductase subunit D